MAEEEAVARELRVLAVASHVTYGYVGNKTTTFTLQLLGCDVSAIHTVHFSNHVGYRQFTGRRVPAAEISDIYNGLCKSRLTDFDLLLSGYTGSGEAVRAVGEIARDLKRKRGHDFFWILDPVMGDAGRLYVAGDIPYVYREQCREADMILPNEFELGLLAEVKVHGLRSAVAAIERLHTVFGTKHIVVTSMRLRRKDLPGHVQGNDGEDEVLGVIGSTSKSDGTARPFLLTIPLLPIFFSGTGDVFAALMAVRFHEASAAMGLVRDGQSWAPADDIEACALPLAKAAEKVLSSMVDILVKTEKRRKVELGQMKDLEPNLSDDERAKQEHLRNTKASEVRIVSFVDELRRPSGKVNDEVLRAVDLCSLLRGAPSDEG